MKRIICVAAFAIAKLAIAGENDPGRDMSIAGYFIGMSNAEAAKIGLHGCVEKYSRITCEAKLPSLPGRVRSILEFDPKTKRLGWIFVESTQFTDEIRGPLAPAELPQNWPQERWWSETNGLSEKFSSALGFTGCKSLYQDTEAFDKKITDGCYVGDVSRRIIRSFNPTRSSSGRRYIGNDPHFGVSVELKRDGGVRRYKILQEIKNKDSIEKQRLERFQRGE